MTGRQRIAAALRGEQPDRVPVMLHNFMMAAREAGISMDRFRRDPRALAGAFLEAVEKYQYDGILVDVDTATLAGAVGVPVDFPEDMPARTKAPGLARLEEVSNLAPAEVGKYWGVQVWLEATALLVRAVGSEVLVRGNCDQDPFALACAMRSIENWMTDLADDANQALAERLLEYCTDATTQFIRLMAGTGAQMVSNGDSSAGPELISPRMYRTFALPYEKRIAACAHEAGLPYVLHICGKTDRILEDMVSSGADGLELDYKTDAVLAAKALSGRATFIGNIDPSGVLALGTPELVERKTRELLEVFRGNPRFILNAGCAIPAETPARNLKAMIRVAREF